MEELREVPGTDGRYLIDISTKEGRCISLYSRYSGDDADKPLKEEERLLAEIDLATKNRDANQKKLDDTLKTSTTVQTKYNETLEDTSAKEARAAQAAKIYKETVLNNMSEVQREMTIAYEEYMERYALLKEAGYDTTLLTEQFLAKINEIQTKALEADNKIIEDNQA